MLPFAWSNGAAVTNEDGTEYTIDSPEMAEPLDYYTSFFEDGNSADPHCSTRASSRAASPTAPSAPSSPGRGTPAWSRRPA